MDVTNPRQVGLSTGTVGEGTLAEGNAMKTRHRLAIVGICGTLVVNVFGQDADPKASPPKAPPAKSSAAPGAAVPAEPAPVTTAETLQKLGMPAPRYPAHPPEKKASGGSQVTVPTTPKFVMATPPPALRPETKPAAPAGNYVWVPGHYVPLNDEWRWVAG